MTNSASYLLYYPTMTERFKIKKGLITLLNDKDFLPDGGLLGFGLSYRYPIDPKTTRLDEFGTSLKGSDAAIKRACDSLSLEVSVKALYESEREEEVACLLDKLDIFDDLAWDMVEEDLALWFKQRYPASGLLVYDSDISSHGINDPEHPNYSYYSEYREFESAQPIVWVKPFTQSHYDIKAPYVAYGNDYSLGYAYGEICLVLKVKASKDRKIYHE